MQIGDGNTQIIYSYNRLTWTDGVSPPPLIAVSGRIESPYRGLRAFEEQDAAFFFGREAATASLLDRLSRQLNGSGPLVVSGVSGAGKSSLLKAGVLPQLRGGGLAAAPAAATWPCLVFTPGHAPLDELAVRVAALARMDAAAMRRGLEIDPASFALTTRQVALTQANGQISDPGSNPKRLILLVDQFEQLFTQCTDELQRQAFVTALHAAATSARRENHGALVMLGVRADFEARCTDYPQLADAVQDRYLVTSMTARQLRMAITEPAKQAGSRVDEELVEALLDEISTHRSVSSSAERGPVSQAGVLPLLSHALDQAWRNRAGATLSLADYERTRGIEGAVADSAQRAYDRLTPAQQTVARQVFTQLVTTSQDGVDTADRVARTELINRENPAEAADVEAVLEAFAAERLLTLGAGTVEISHEVLLTSWPLLRDTWLATTHADRIIRSRLHSVASEWKRADRDPSYLYSGTLLEAAAEAVARTDLASARQRPLSGNERDFLRASERARRRRALRRRTFTAFLAATVVALAFVATWAYRASQDAIQQRDGAVSRQLINESESLGDTDPAIARLESIAAWGIHPSADARYAMLAAAALPGIATLNGHTDYVVSVAFSPDGKTIVSGSSDHTVRLWDLGTRRQIGSPLTGHTDTVRSVAFSPDGKTIVSGSSDHTVRLWDLATHQQIGSPLTGHTDAVYSVAFSPDGKTIVSGSADHTVRLWDLATRRQTGSSLTGHTDSVNTVAFSSDGKTVVSGGADDTLRLWDVGSHRQIGTFPTGHTQFKYFSNIIYSATFSPDGKTVVSGSADDKLRLWDVATRRQIGSPLTGHSNFVYSVAFSPDGKTIVSGSADHTVRLWDVANRRQIGSSLTGDTDGVSSVAYSPDGTTVVSAGADHTVRLWDVTSYQRIENPFTGHTDVVISVAFSPDGKTIVSGSADRTVRLWDVATRRQIGSPLTGHTNFVYSVAFSPDGKTIVSGSADHTVRLWDVAAHQQIGSPLTGHTDTVQSVAFSPDGKTIVSGSADHTVRLWDVATRRQIGSPLTGHTDAVYSVAFSPDGKTVVSGGGDFTIRLWDVATLQQIGDSLTGHTNVVYSVAFSPDGKTVVSGSFDQTLRRWDVATRQQIGSPLTGHTYAVISVAFSPDGKTLVSGSADHTVGLWDVATHQPIGNPLTGHTRNVTSVAFSPDGKTVVSGGADHTLRLWDVGYLVNIVPHLCAVIGRSFTPEEWRTYVPPGPAYRSLC
ncbi:hypothetical protein OG558_15425 [Kribbella sp. NBC_01510]|uniref:nSTAND1 domain-containing NTPase n=1 Tax=Kribbella sp. NBC_01510 TaxID=2903581 RepID=UPI003870C09A